MSGKVAILTRLQGLQAIAGAGGPPSAVIVFAYLTRRRNRKTDQLNPSQPTIAEDTGLSERHVRRAIQWLDAFGAIRVIKSEGLSDHYTVDWQRLVKFDAGIDAKIKANDKARRERRAAAKRRPTRPTRRPTRRRNTPDISVQHPGHGSPVTPDMGVRQTREKEPEGIGTLPKLPASGRPTPSAVGSTDDQEGPWEEADDTVGESSEPAKATPTDEAEAVKAMTILSRRIQNGRATEADIRDLHRMIDLAMIAFNIHSSAYGMAYGISQAEWLPPSDDTLH